MLTMRCLVVSVIFAAAICRADPFANLVTNGGFETGNFSGWTLSGDSDSVCLFVGTTGDPRCVPATAIGPHSGKFAAQLGNGGADATMSQTITTNSGGTYDVSFWLANQGPDTPANDFSVKWGSKTLMSAVNLPVSGYKTYDFSGLLAAGPTTVLSFTFRNDPTYFALDDISVVDPPPMPEPSPLGAFTLLLVLPLLCVCAGEGFRPSGSDPSFQDTVQLRFEVGRVLVNTCFSRAPHFRISSYTGNHDTLPSPARVGPRAPRPPSAAVSRDHQGMSAPLPRLLCIRRRSPGRVGNSPRIDRPPWR